MSQKEKKEITKKCPMRAFTWNALIIALFALISLAYFAPAVWEGRELFQQDVAGASGTAQDVRNYKAQTGEHSYWTNSLFGGMPMYQISPSYPSLNVLKLAQDSYTLKFPLNLLPSYSWLLFAMLVGFFIFMQSLGVKRWSAFLGAVFWAFSSYFIILIDAGHIWKLMVLAFIPPTIAGIIYTYRGQYLKGGIITTFFAALQLMSNHVQMSYYFAFLIAFMLIAFFVEALRQKEVKRFLQASLTLLVSAVLAIAMNASNLYHTYEYSKQTMRGGSALAPETQGNSGLDKAYITQWSYGKVETLTFLVPNLYGGSSAYVGQDEDLMSQVEPKYQRVLAQMSQYWGDQPFTSGPVYVGAFVLFLFILGAFVVKTPMKWALLAGTLLSILLSWGHNLMWLSDLFIDYFPLYNKFRTVSSILVVAEFTIPTLAILALVEFLKAPKELLKNYRSELILSLSLTMGLALLFALVPNLFFDFLSDRESELFKFVLAQGGVTEVLDALKGLRASVVASDAWRSVWVIALSLVPCALYYYGKLSKELCLALVIVISFVDLWSVDKRYLNDSKFVDMGRIEAMAKPITQADKVIAEDKDPHFRVYNMSVSSFNDATTSANHRSIGGYHAAKLSRYQDLIEHQIAKGNKAVLNMLDTRYIIQRDQQGNYLPLRNNEAFGAVWFVDELSIVSDAGEAMSALSSEDLLTRAVIERDDLPKNWQGDYSVNAELSSIKLDSYMPNRATYSANCADEVFAVFSEIYYPKGWHLLVDGKEVPIIRTNYTLRGAFLPKGEHKLEMYFKPKSLELTELASIIAQIILLLALCVFIVQIVRKK